MTKILKTRDMVSRIQHSADRKLNEAEGDVDELLSIMMEAIKEDGKLLISGFGKFESYAKASRRGRNPQTGEALTLDPRRVCVFRISRAFKDELNPCKKS